MTGREQEMTADRSKATAEAEIRALIDAQAEAIRAKDIDGSAANYAPDVLLFDVVNPLQSIGADAARRRLAEWFSSFEGPIGYELRDLTIAAGDDVAFAHSLSRVRATTTAGKKLDMWWRATVCYRRIDGAWTITHAHAPGAVRRGERPGVAGPQAIERGRAGAADAPRVTPSKRRPWAGLHEADWDDAIGAIVGHTGRGPRLMSARETDKQQEAEFDEALSHPRGMQSCRPHRDA
jgi:uncharacterized protein (TIGR02246 family)